MAARKEHDEREGLSPVIVAYTKYSSRPPQSYYTEVRWVEKLLVRG